MNDSKAKGNPTHSHQKRGAKISLAALFGLFWTFFKVGAFTFGGGFAMIPIIKKELVDRKQWLDESHFVDSIAVTQTVPGAVAVNLAVFLGYSMAGVAGSLAAALGVVLPSFTIISLIAWGLQGATDIPLLEAFFLGVRPAVVALILYAGWSIVRNTEWTWGLAVLAVGAGTAAIVGGVSPITLIVLGALAGIVHYQWRRVS